jgi:hypothetical protein
MGSELQAKWGQSFDLPDALRACGVRALIFTADDALAEMTVGRERHIEGVTPAAHSIP